MTETLAADGAKAIMESRTRGSLIQDLRRVVLLRDQGGAADVQILEWFLSERDDAAFEILVRRHGPMVLGVCRRVLGRLHDAEDAFQATFMVLSRKARDIIRRENLGAWLHGVAFRIAVRAKALNARRRAKERQVYERIRPEAASEPEPEMQDWEPILDEEIHRLPEKYRVPLVLCELQGKSRKQAAQELELPEGTLSSRLARARTLLKKRLTRHGVALGLGALLAQVASAAVPTQLLSATVKAATAFPAGQGGVAGLASAKSIALAEGMSRTLGLSKLTFCLAVVLGTGLLGLAGWAGDHWLASRQDSSSAPQPLAVRTPHDPPAAQPSPEQTGGESPQEPAASSADEGEEAASAEAPAPKPASRPAGLSSRTWNGSGGTWPRTGWSPASQRFGRTCPKECSNKAGPAFAFMKPKQPVFLAPKQRIPMKPVFPRLGSSGG